MTKNKDTEKCVMQLGSDSKLENLYLYGKIRLNSANIKILCLPESFDKYNNPNDIQMETIGQSCLRFKAGDLQNLTGFHINEQLRKKCRKSYTTDKTTAAGL